MKKISYSTTMAILLAGSMAIMPVFAAEQIDADLEDDCGCQHARSLEESLDQQLVPDSTSFGVAKAIRKGLKAENKSITYQRRNIQTAPTFGDVLKAPFRLVSNGIGSLIQSTLCAGGVKTFVKYDQHCKCI